MLTKSLCTVLGLCAFTVGFPVIADQSYAGGGAAYLDFSSSSLESDLNVGAVYARAGTELNKYLSYEVRGMLGVLDDSITESGESFDYSIDYSVGMYVRGKFEITPTFAPYFILGFAHTKVALESNLANLSTSESDVSYGVGLDVNLVNDIGLNFELMNYLDKDGVEINGLSASIVRLF